MKTKSLLFFHFFYRRCFVLFSIFFALISNFSAAQSETHNFITYDTIYVNGSFSWNIRITRPANMFTPGHPDTASRPALIAMNGVGEVGTNPNVAAVYGPHYWLNNGWDGGITLGNGTHYPIIVTITCRQYNGGSYINPRGPQIDQVVNHVLNTYHIKRNSVHFSGLSMGAFTWGRYLTYEASAGAETGMKNMTSLVCLQGASNETFPPYDAWSLGWKAFGHWAKKYGGKFMGFEGTSDTRNVWNIRDNMEDSVAGSAYFTFENFGGGAHCCWNSMYDPNRHTWQCVAPMAANLVNNTNHPNSMGNYENGWNIFEWQLRQGDTSMVGSTSAAPIVSAGNNQSLQLPISIITLSGTVQASSGNSITSTTWTKLSGPACVILTPLNLITVVTGFGAGNYVFELTAVDNNGQSASSTVTINVLAAPPPNQAPSANAGPDKTITLPVNTTTLSGSGNDPDGSIASYQWTKISGSAQYAIATPATAQTVINNLAQGVYQFELKVTDDDGATGKDTVSVTVNPAATGGGSGGSSIKVGQGEYQAYFLDANKHLWGLGNITNIGTNNVGVQGVPARSLVTPFDLKFKAVAGGLHGGAAIDTAGNVWGLGDNDQAQMGIGNITHPIYTPQKILVDSAGNPFTNVKEMSAFFLKIDGNGFNGWYAVKEDGTLWVWGAPMGGMRGQGTDNTALDSLCMRPVQIQIPGNRLVKQIVSGTMAIALCTDGTVWTWGKTSNNNLGYTATGNDYTYPHQLTQLSGIDQVAGGIAFNYALKNDGTLYGWGAYGAYMGEYATSGGGVPKPTPVVLTNIMNNLPAPITRIVTNTVCTHVILADSSLWGWGDNAQGNIGNGQELDYENTTPPYSWSYASGMLLVQYPYNVAPTKKFTNVFGSSVYTFYTYALDEDDQLYCWGRNKGSVLANRIRGASSSIVATFPNGFDVAWPKPVDPFTITSSFPSTGKTCLQAPSGTPCNSYTIPANTAPVADAGNDQTISVSYCSLDGTGSTDNVYIPYYTWSQVNGPNTAIMDLPGSATPKIYGLVTGIYTFKLKVTDNGWLSDSATVQIFVNVTPPPNQAPTANAGSDRTITLPVTTTTLAGSGNDPDGTITSYQWTKISGPAQYAIVSPAAAQTVINNLVQGVYQFVLTVTDDDGATGNDTVKVTVNAALPNQPPTANAGPDKTITLPVNTTTLSGSGNDPDGTITAYQWTKISGPAQYAIVTPATAQTVINNLVQGVYQFVLTVTDNNGATGKDTVNVTVNAAPVNQPPTANAGPDKTITLPVNTTTLSGSGNDPDGTITAYQWTKISGPAQYTIATPATAQTVVNNLVQGVYQFVLTVTDNNGATGKDTVNVTVNAPVNQPPTANAGPDISITLPVNTATLNGSGNDPDGTITTYLWSKISGPSQFVVISPNNPQTVVNNLVQGVYQFVLTVTDNNGATGKDTVNVTVNAAIPNQPPTANAGPDKTITLPVNTTTLSGSGNDPDGTITAYQWTKISGPAQYAIVTPATAQTVVNNLVQGVYQFVLTVTDDDGATGKDTVNVTVNAVAPNQPPAANAGPDKTITLPLNSTTLTGSGNDPDGTITAYQWTKISGPAQYTIATPATAQTVVNNLVQGVYQFVLTVTDNNGATDSDTVSVTVNAAAPNQAPTANAGPDITLTLPVNSTTLTGSGNDPDGTITSYQWNKISGPTQFSITSPGTAQTTITNLVEGVYLFMLTVKDNYTATGMDTVQVTVYPAPPPNQLPTAMAGNDMTITLPLDSVNATGAGTDPDGTIVTYQWTKISGPAQYQIVTPNQPATAIKNLVEGVYLFELKVTDNDGGSATDTLQITVKPDTRRSSTAMLYPNPAVTTVNVSINSITLNNTTKVQIFNIAGIIMYQTEVLRTQQQITIPIDISKWPKGSYVVRIGADINTTVTKILIKQ